MSIRRVTGVSNPPTTYDTINNAYSACVTGDLIQLETDISDEQLTHNQNIYILIRTDGPRRTWGSSSGTAITLTSTVNTQFIIQDIDFNIGSFGNYGILQQSGSYDNFRMVIDSCTFTKTEGVAVCLNFQMSPTTDPGSGQYHIVIYNSKIKGRNVGSDRCISLPNTTKNDTLYIYNSIITNTDRGIDVDTATASVVPVIVESCVIEGCIVGVEMNSKVEINNSLFGNNTTDITLGTYGDKADVTYTGLGTDSTSGYPASCFSITESSEWVDYSNENFRLKDGATSRENGSPHDSTDIENRKRYNYNDVGPHRYLYPDAIGI
jgi:hypothetical protein